MVNIEMMDKANELAGDWNIESCLDYERLERLNEKGLRHGKIPFLDRINQAIKDDFDEVIATIEWGESQKDAERDYWRSR